MEEKIKIFKAVNSRILKVDLEKRLISGVVSEPDTIDLQGDILLSKDIENAAYKYLEGEKIIGYRHQKVAEGVKLLEGIVFQQSVWLKNDDTNTEEYIRKGSFYVTLKIDNEEIWNQVKNQELNSFSIGGWGDRIPALESQIDTSEYNQDSTQPQLDLSKVYILANLEIEEISIVTWGANNKKFVMRKDENREGKLFFEKQIIDKNGDDIMVVSEEEKLKMEKELKEELHSKMEKEFAEEKARLEKEAKDAKELAAKLEKEETDAANELTQTKQLAKDAMETARLEKEARLTKEFVDIAKEKYPIIGDNTQIGMLLKEASEKLSKEANDVLGIAFAAANEKLKKSDLFREVGSKTEKEESNPDKLDRLAKEYMEKNKVSYSAALTAVVAANPELYGKK